MVIYATGLYDYLEQRVARRLTNRLFHLLAPRGRLLIASFSLRTREQAYMEAFMNWSLVYRSESELADVSSEVDGSRLLERSSFTDPEGNVIYVMLRAL